MDLLQGDQAFWPEQYMTLLEATGKHTKMECQLFKLKAMQITEFQSNKKEMVLH